MSNLKSPKSEEDVEDSLLSQILEKSRFFFQVEEERDFFRKAIRIASSIKNELLQFPEDDNDHFLMERIVSDSLSLQDLKKVFDCCLTEKTNRSSSIVDDRKVSGKFKINNYDKKDLNSSSLKDE